MFICESITFVVAVVESVIIATCVRLLFLFLLFVIVVVVDVVVVKFAS